MHTETDINSKIEIDADTNSDTGMQTLTEIQTYSGKAIPRDTERGLPRLWRERDKEKLSRRWRERQPERDSKLYRDPT